MTRPKTGGRQPGTPNKRTTDLLELLEARFGADFDPVVSLVEIALDPATPLDLRVKCLGDVAPYCRPKLRVTDATGGGITLEDLVNSSMHDFRPPVVTTAPTPAPAPAPAVIAPPATKEAEPPSRTPSPPPAAFRFREPPTEPADAIYNPT